MNLLARQFAQLLTEAEDSWTVFLKNNDDSTVYYYFEKDVSFIIVAAANVHQN